MIRRPKRAPLPNGERAVHEHTIEPDLSFLHRLQEGDETAWKQFLDEWNPRLFRYMKYNLRDASEAEEVLSETWVALVQAIRTFDGKVTLATFIYSIAYRKVADYWRRLRVTQELTEWITTGEDDHTRVEVYEALAELPEQSQQALLLRYYVGLSVAEIAEVLGRSYKATESLLSRVRRQFEVAFMNGAEA
jgi:RNA polymerase sigma-70 factor (ECF subfamily)